MSRVISLRKEVGENEVEGKATLRWWLLASTAKLAALLLTWALLTVSGQRVGEFLSAGVSAAQAWAIEQVTRVEVVRQYAEPIEMSLDDVIEAAAKREGINPIILHAIAEQESSKGAKLYRFEPRVFERLKVSDENERRMLASSHGVFQVMGFNAERLCELHWSRLYDEQMGAACAIRILKQNIRSTKGTPAARLRDALRMYNGSGPDAEAYANKVMSRIAALMLKDLGSGVL